MIPESQIKSDEKLCAEATAGPWELGLICCDNHVVFVNDASSNICKCDDAVFDDPTKATVAIRNSMFIIRARTALPEYIAENKLLRARIAELETAAWNSLKERPATNRMVAVIVVSLQGLIGTTTMAYLDDKGIWRDKGGFFVECHQGAKVIGWRNLIPEVPTNETIARLKAENEEPNNAAV